MLLPCYYVTAFFFAIKICLRHQSVTPFLSGTLLPKKNPGSASEVTIVRVEIGSYNELFACFHRAISRGLSQLLSQLMEPQFLQNMVKKRTHILIYLVKKS